MAEHSQDRMITMSIGGLSASNRRLVEQLMLRVDGVAAYRLTDDGLLTVALTDYDEEPLVRALLAAGILPNHTTMGNTSTHGGPRAC